MIPTIGITSTFYLLMASEGAEHLGLFERILESNVINIVLVALVLGFLAKKFNLLGGIDAKQAQLSSEILAIENQKKAALTQLQDAKNRTANLKAEVAEILENARESAQLISAQIISDASLESSKIVENAKRRVALEQRSALHELEKRLLNDAISDARSEMSQTLTAADQKHSVEEFLQELSQLKGNVRS